MTKKMTTGEIAKKVGISQKAVRLYDENGLLKPSEYSEGNYRLYDKEALLVLEKIIALKQVGFSLEEIKENLIQNDNGSILETLQIQIDMMEAKRYELEKAITRIKAAIARSGGKPDWDDVTDIIRDIQADQKADEGHFHALKHNADNLDWYVKIYNSLDIKEGEHVLDLGCGFSKVWRNNWTDIPANGEHLFWKDSIKAAGLNPSFAVDKYHEAKEQGDEFRLVLEKYFTKIEEVILPSPFRYESAEELFERAIDHFPEAKDYLEANKTALTAYFDKLIKKNGEVIIDGSGLFWHCYK